MASAAATGNSGRAPRWAAVRHGVAEATIAEGSAPSRTDLNPARGSLEFSSRIRGALGGAPPYRKGHRHAVLHPNTPSPPPCSPAASPPPRRRTRRPAGWAYDNYCCGGNDCQPIPTENVQVTPDGYVVTIPNGQHVTAQRDHLKLFRYDEVRESGDENFHGCILPGSQEFRCLYVPEFSG